MDCFGRDDLAIIKYTCTSPIKIQKHCTVNTVKLLNNFHSSMGLKSYELHQVIVLLHLKIETQGFLMYIASLKTL